MKLYATTTSERASKGQGGNQRLDIQISLENNTIQGGVISVRKIDDNYIILYTYQGDQKNIATIKGEKQKGKIECGCETNVFACRKHIQQ